MKCFLRPYRCVTCCLALLAGAILFAASATSPAQARFTPLIADANTQATTNNPGYLGIDIADIETDRVQSLRLKDTHGALVTLIDHDAPAGQVGLKVNDVVLQLDGQTIDSADQFRRLMKDLPAGRKITIQFSRDGNIQSLAVELCDRKVMEKNVWSKLGSTSTTVPQMGIVGSDTMPSGFHLPSFGSNLKVGALVEPLTPQMATYLGVSGGLIVKEVDRRSDAETAGLHAFDVILKVGTDSIATSADWDRALRANQGKPVPLTILRDKKQQVLTLQVDSKHHQGKKNPEGPLTAEQKHELAQLQDHLTDFSNSINERLANQIAAQADGIAKQAQAESDAMRDRFEGMHFGMSPEQAEQLRQQTDKLRESLKDFQVDPKLIQEMNRQMEEFRKGFNPDEFKIDPKEMQEFQQQMDQFRKQMLEWRTPSTGNFV